jgi:hypothetical protein
VGIVGITGAILYGSLRAVGWSQQIPELLKAPMRYGNAWQALRAGVGKMSERARSMGEPLDPGGPPEPKV